jgi:hypothetical protein
METCIATHISEHFISMTNKLVNMICDKAGVEKNIKDDKWLKIKTFRSDLTRIKNDVINDTNTCDTKYDPWKNFIRSIMFTETDKQRPLEKDFKEKPFKMLPMLIRMSRAGEILMQFRMYRLPKEEQKQFKIINVFPLRKSNIPHYIDIDSQTLIKLIMDENYNKHYYLKNCLKKNEEIWKFFFKTDDRVFKKTGYTFNRRISTDGYGCSILFIRSDLYKADKKSYAGKAKKKPYSYNEYKYLEQLPKNELTKLQTKKSVGIDPGHKDILYGTDGDTKIVERENGKKRLKTETFRFTQNQRRFEIKTKVNRKKMNRKKKSKKVGGKSIEKIESDLSIHNADSCRYEKMNSFVIRKNDTNDNVRDFYDQFCFRAQRWYSKINKRKSDDKMVNEFKKKFGDHKNTVILMGDYSQKNMKFLEPSKGKSIRRLFTRHGYKLYLVNEFRTSCRMFDQGVEMETFKKAPNPKPLKMRGKNGKAIITRHGLLRSKICTNITNGATSKEDVFTHTLMNRNLNGSLNILLKGKCIIHGKEIPKYLQRPKRIEQPIKEDQK